jgi:DNA-directed DNA polymerase III PolC
MSLNCHSYFSFHYGTLKPEELLQEARDKGLDTIALTDINNTSGCLSFIREAPKYHILPVVGIDFRNGVKQEFIGIARNNEGFGELNTFLSSCLQSGEAIIPEQAPAFSNVHIIYPFGKIHPSLLRANEYIGIRPGDQNKLLFSGWDAFTHKLLALTPVTFRNKKDFNVHRLLRAIGKNTLLSKLPLSEQAGEQEKMLTETESGKIYERFPELLLNTRRLLHESEIHFEFHKSKNKKTVTGDAGKDYELLKLQSEEGLRYRYGDADEAIRKRLQSELEIIREMDFVSYFLITWDIVSYARKQGYFYVGRGSGANSIVAYCLRITDVDPVDLDLYFERFINVYRVNPPDFDIDFSWADRDDVIRYIFEKHGRKHTALLATYNTFQQKSVLRELGKVLGLPKEEIDALVEERKNPRTPDHIAALIYKYSHCLNDFPNHLSIHAGGILISEKPICSYSALNIPPKGLPLVQFSMIEAEDLGLYKFDILSQRGLGHIKDAVALVKQNKGIDIDIHDIKKFKTDEKIKDLLRVGKTMGCFYVESPAMRMLLKKLRVDDYLGLVAASSIIRPGVASSGMMREYILRFRYPERRNDAIPEIRELLNETYGVMVYQEDVIKVAHYFAGLTLAEADVLRRGMSGKFRGREEFQKAEEKFLSNCREKGHPDELTNEIWRQIKSFAGYSFSKGHSASYAVESYQSLYLKAYFPNEFMVGVINNFGGFYNTEYYIHEARMGGAQLLPPCINHSEPETSIQQDTIYMGFIHLHEMDAQTSKALIAERNARGAFSDLSDFMNRVHISLDKLRILIRIGAFRFTGKNKKELLWELHMILGKNRKTKPSPELFESRPKTFTLPSLSRTDFDDALDEIEILGYPLCSPFSLLGDQPGQFFCMHDLMAHVGKRIDITGYLVATKKTHTKHGETMCFGTFLDKQGFFFDTTHFPKIAYQFPFQGKGCYLLAGKVTEEFGYPSIEVEQMKKVPYEKLSKLFTH